MRKIVISVSASVPMPAGFVLHTPFGDETITQAQSDSGFYNHTISSNILVDSNITDEQLQGLVTSEAARISGLIGA